MVSDNDKKQLRAYYMLYDQTRPDPDEHTKYVFSTFNIYYPIEQTLNDMMLFKINPNASRYDSIYVECIAKSGNNATFY